MKKHRAFLKWAGGKYSLAEDICRRLPEADVLVEPFVGAASVFLNSDFERYVLNDINQDLINLYRHLARAPAKFIRDSRELFRSEYNDRHCYYQLRNEFNASRDSYRRSQLFLYMNRHGFNGLCRYNRQGGFNVPFGSYKRPYFPEEEMWFFAEKARKATFTSRGYDTCMDSAKDGAVIYCDPPYAPLSTSAYFTSYASHGFSLKDQEGLADKARETAARGVPVLISNHDTPLTRLLYQGAELDVVQVKRTISRNGAGRQKVDELLALYPG
ncbi:Dam family site-specific DNA-(adenine-N6)-methyltransferase [Gallaecimonas sp. GXIMD4217]|uniref:Dam family site-specific DNA-(adenine-N6)-methyltransferase n=1 Tax=Gallaecimonas sp. GXIMD4217 TaxID=3131927 RepID=UPI00311AF4ED